MDKYIGRLLDSRYEILEVIGTGGMAVVYKARCHRLNRLVAIKILKDDYLEDEEFRRRFHSESQAVAMLSHPNIVSIYDVSSSITADYIVMELIDGITLKQYMEKKGVLNWKETLHFAIQIGKALEHAHSRGIVHRDIKPHNVMVLKNGSVKVTDFGIARVMSQSNTLTKEALGSVHYISPEQAKGGRVDSRSDIYSLGVVMYEMMSGRPPYDGESPVSVAIKHINGGAAMPSTLNPNIPGGLEQIIMHAMAVEPGDRYASTTKMLADMDEFRKNPGILFDYNTPPLDDVIRIQKPPLVLEPEKPKPPVQQPERKRTENPAGQRRRPTQAAAAAGAKRSERRSAQVREEEHRSNVATVAIIACSAVMVLAIVVFLIVLLNDGTGNQPELIEVPSLIGQDFDTLAQNPNYEVKLNERVHDSQYLPGQIINQNPLPGDSIRKGETIYVTVSLGPVQQAVKMPNLIPDWKREDAERALSNLGLNLDVQIEEENHDQIPQGEVIRTDPVADTELTAGQKVTLYISLGMEFKTGYMQDVVGYEKDAAHAVLIAQPLDLDITYEEIFDPEVPAGCVVRTNPEKNTEITTGEKITVYISKGPQTVKLTNVLNLTVDSAVSILKGDGIKNYKIETVENEKAKDTVIELRVDGQPVEPGTDVSVEATVVIVVSMGPAAQVTKTEKIMLPEEAIPPYTVTVDLAGTPIFAQDITEDFTGDSISVEMTGSGVQEYHVYIDGKLAITAKVDFTK